MYTCKYIYIRIYISWNKTIAEEFQRSNGKWIFPFSPSKSVTVRSKYYAIQKQGILIHWQRNPVIYDEWQIVSYTVTPI